MPTSDNLRENIMMKKSSLALAISVMVSGPAFSAAFVNGGFETGDLSGWTQGGGCWNSNNCASNVYVPYTGGALPTAPQYAGGTPVNTIMSAGTDPYTGQNTVYNGNYSVRVNNSINNYSVSTISQSVANYTDNDIYFQWNAVLESSHGLNNSDYFSLTLTDNTTNTVLLTRSFSSASAPATFTYYNGWYGSGWQLEHIDLTTAGAGGTSIVGHDLTLSLLASDCPYGGHAGYVYLDGFAPTIQPPGPNPTPEPATLALLGLGLAGLSAARRRKVA